MHANPSCEQSNDRRQTATRATSSQLSVSLCLCVSFPHSLCAVAPTLRSDPEIFLALADMFRAVCNETVSGVQRLVANDGEGRARKRDAFRQRDGTVADATTLQDRARWDEMWAWLCERATVTRGEPETATESRSTTRTDATTVFSLLFLFVRSKRREEERVICL